MSEYPSDALVTLGGGTNKKSGVVTPRTLARVDAARHAYNFRRAPRIIMVGGYWLGTGDAHEPQTSEAQQMKDYALRCGVPNAAILKAGEDSRETIGNALFTKEEVLIPNDWRTVDVVTSVTHLPRSLNAFRHVLGPEYVVGGIEAPEKWVLPKRGYEVLGLMVQNYVLDGTEPGDDEAIYARLTERVPGYGNDVTMAQLAANSLLHAAKLR